MRVRRENKRKQLLMGAIIVFIMVTSVIGFMFGRGSEEAVDYNGFSFVRKGNLWETKIDKQPVVFSYFPSQIELIEVDAPVISRMLSTPMLYLTYDQNQSEVEFIAQAQFELDTVLYGRFNIYSGKGLTKENEYNLPVITCLNATSAVPVVDFRKANETIIHMEGECIIVGGRTGNDFIRAKDRLLYGMFGIIK